MDNEISFEERRILAQQDIYETRDLIKEYRSALRGLKCPVHGKGARIDHCHQYEQYDDGNYTHIYFTQCCCSTLMAKVEKRMKEVFPKYENKRIYESDEI